MENINKKVTDKKTPMNFSTKHTTGSYKKSQTLKRQKKCLQCWRVRKKLLLQLSDKWAQCY